MEPADRATRVGDKLVVRAAHAAERLLLEEAVKEVEGMAPPPPDPDEDEEPAPPTG